MAKGMHPMHGDSDAPEDPWGMECAFASTVVDSEATGLSTVKTRFRIDWPTQGNETEPRPPSQQLTHTREGEGEPLCKGITERTEQQRGTEAHQVDSMRNTAVHHRTHLPKSMQSTSGKGEKNLAHLACLVCLFHSLKRLAGLFHSLKHLAGLFYLIYAYVIN